VTSLTGSAGAGSISAEGEATLTCESADISGTAEAGGTTGTISYDFTNCHMTVFGSTAKCHTTGSPLDNTFKTSGTFYFITTPQKAPGTLITLVTTEMICAGISSTIWHGNLIGTITSRPVGPKALK